MTLDPANRPRWLTFDCYGTLIQWDEGLCRTAEAMVADRGRSVDLIDILRFYDIEEGEAQRSAPYKPFRELAPASFLAALRRVGVTCDIPDGETLLRAIPTFGPFPETIGTLAALKAGGFELAIISNTDDDLVAGNVAQLGGHIDHVVTAQQARAYKPSRILFEHARKALGAAREEIVHVCASPAVDLVAARDQVFRCIWIDRGTYRKPLADYRPDETLPDLTGLPGLFERLGWTRG